MVQPMVARSSPARGRVANDALKAAPDHRGEARAFDVELFAAPPPEIGTITSAESTLRPGKEPFSPPVRLLILLLPAAAVFGIVWVLTQGMRPSERESLRIIGGGMGGAVALLVAWYYTRFKHRCTYVGEGGAALFELRGSRDRTPSAKVGSGKATSSPRSCVGSEPSCAASSAKSKPSPYFSAASTSGGPPVATFTVPLSFDSSTMQLLRPHTCTGRCAAISPEGKRMLARTRVIATGSPSVG